MDKKTITVGVLVLAAIVGLMAWGRFNASDARANQVGGPGSGNASEFSIPETFYDFGTISMRDGLVERRFTITNPTSVSVELTSIYTSCMCTAAYLETPKGEKGPFRMQGMGYVPPANETIGAGESREVRVVYDPNAHGPAGVGAIDRFVYLVDDSGGVSSLEIKAVVTP